tara:strand:- start:16064 stop:16507 length:444 start_codon:yes stop_codon:yes gene_type:complete
MKKLIAIFITLLSFNDLSAQKYTDTYIKDANKIGLEWWNQVNSAQYEISYKNLSDVLKSRATLKDWINQISMLMDEFGDFKKRTVRDTYFKSGLEGFEDGFYVMIEYDVEYSKTKNHTEYLLLKQNDKFEWQILDFNYTFQNLETIE